MPSGAPPQGDPPGQAPSPQPGGSTYAPPTGAHPGGYTPPYQEGPGNPQAVAALVLGIVSVTMAILGFFLITLPIAVICGVIAIVLGGSGKRKVDRGETKRQRGLAQAGFITGIIGTVLGLLGIVGLVLLFTLSEEFQRGFERGFEQGYGGVALAGMVIAARRPTITG